MPSPCPCAGCKRTYEYRSKEIIELIRSIDQSEAASSSRDFGRGYSLAIKDVIERIEEKE